MRLACLVLLATARVGLADPFANLDFNSPPNLPDETIPGWSSENAFVFLGPSVCLGSVCITLHEELSENRVFLQSGYSVQLDQLVRADLSQVGDVPADARTILLESRVEPTDPTTSHENLRVSIDDIDIPLMPLSLDGSRILMGGDISAFAGEMVKLTVYTITPIPPDEYWADLYSVAFSSVPIPEPSTLLLATACLALATRSKRSVRHAR